MKIKYALMSSNANPEYLDFWPVAAKAWLDVGITPVLFYIPDHAEDAPISQVMPADVPGSEVHTIPHLPDVNIVLQSSLLRFWGSCYYPDDIVIVSDIDLLPLSRRFFTDQLADVADNCYVHLRCVPGGHGPLGLRNIPGNQVTEIPNMRYLNACWHAGNGNLMHKILWPSQKGETSDWESDCKQTIPYHYVQGDGHYTYTITDRTTRRGKIVRFNAHGDELYLSMRVHLFPEQNIVRYITQKQYHFLDRSNWYYKSEILSQGSYSAAHLPRPYHRYKPNIDALLQQRALSPTYRFCFFMTRMTAGFGYRFPKHGVFLSYLALITGECVFGMIFWCIRWRGAALLKMHCQTQHVWMRRVNPRMFKLYEIYKRHKMALRYLLSSVRRTSAGE